MQVIRCTEAQLDVLSGLFNDYRVFYGQKSDVAACQRFLKQNLGAPRAEIFLLLNGAGEPVAFSQLYPAVCSLSMRPYWYLSDLYVVRAERQLGHAKYLMNWLTDHFGQRGAQRLTLDTAHTNTIAQALYESLGYEREQVYITYHQTFDRLV